MSTITQVKIANVALGHIAQKPIQSLTEATIQAAAISRIYTPALEETLRVHNWPFAKVIRVLVAIADYDSIKWTYAYAYPSNCVIVRKVLNEATADMEIGEKFEELYDVDTAVKVIATNTLSAYAEYTYLVTDTTLYDATFINAFTHRLASDLAVDLNGDKEMAKAEIAIFNTVISEAQRIASYERHNPITRNSSYVDAR